MKGLWLYFLMGLLAVMVSLAGCAPAAPPAPAPAPPAAAPAPAVSPEEAAWEKVIAAARQEGKVTLYSFSFIGDLGIALSKAFKDKYGISLELVTGTGSQLVPRLESEHRAGQYVADILEGSGINAIFARDRGLTQPYGAMPQLQQSQPWMVTPQYDKEGHILAYSYIVYGPWINTGLVKPGEEPKSWKDLLDPKWKGKMVVTEPDTMPIPGRHYVILTRKLGFDDSYFRKLGEQQLIIAPTQRDNDAMVARGQAPMTLTTGHIVMAPLAAQGAPVKPVDLAEGLPAGASPTLTVLAKAPHANAARLFINWLLSQEGQTIHGRARSIWSLRQDVTDYTPEQIRMKFTKIVPMTPEDEAAAAQVQRDKVVSKLWKK